MKIEEIIIGLESYTDSTFLSTTAAAKLREAMGVMEPVLEGGVRTCYVCSTSNYAGGDVDHLVRCKAQKFLEG